SPLFDLEQPFTVAGGKARAFGAPRFFNGANCFLYRNEGKGRFKDVSQEAGIQIFDLGKPAGKSLGVLASDLDGDGYPEIFVANDTVRNFLFRNVSDGKGGRKFVEVGNTSNVAYAEGAERGAMGVDCAEIRPGLCGLL